MVKILDFQFVCKKFSLNFSINSPIVFDINTGIKKVWGLMKDFAIKPRTYKGLQRFGCSKFIDRYGMESFKKLVRKGVVKKQYTLYGRAGAGLYGLKLGWITRVNPKDWCKVIHPKKIDMEVVRKIYEASKTFK